MICLLSVTFLSCGVGFPYCLSFPGSPLKNTRFPLQAERHGLGDPRGMPQTQGALGPFCRNGSSPDQCLSFLMMMFPEDSGPFDEGMCLA